MHLTPKYFFVQLSLVRRQWRSIASYALALLVLITVDGCGERTTSQQPSGPKTVKTPCGMEMVSIPAGQFAMGDNQGAIDTKPEHQVKLDTFLMDNSEVTQEVYQRVMGTNPSRRKNPSNPVEQVTWSAAAKFCNARSLLEGRHPCYDTNTWACDFSADGYRLPTEAEWEYACRAGDSARSSFENNPEALRQIAWFDGNSQTKPHPVGQRRPNAWGLYDMVGNVWEWCNDFYGVKYYKQSPAENPHGPEQGEKRVLRGGAWSSSAANCCASVRNCDEAGVTDVCLTMDSNGFRCVRRP
jgi:formylglycine-generating enzyme required for sulfatase activity